MRPEVPLRLRAFAVCTAGCAAGWVVFQVTKRTAASVPAMAAWWAGLVISALTVVLMARLLRMEESGEGRTLLAMCGWATAAAAGWFFSVAVGGPFAGLASGLALHHERRRFPDAIATMGAGLVGLWVGWMMGRGGGTLPSLGTALLGFGVLLLVLRNWLPSLPSKWLAWAVVAGMIWVAAWALATRFVPPLLMGYAAPTTEVMLAFTLMGVLCGWLLPLSGHGLRVALAAWVGAGLFSGTVGIVVDLALREAYRLGTGHVAISSAFLDVGHVIGMALGGSLATSVTYRAWRSSSSSSADTRGS